MKADWYDAFNDPDPPSYVEVWIQTKSGIVATGHMEGKLWYSDGYRVRDAWDTIWYWAHIEYPEAAEP